MPTLAIDTPIHAACSAGAWFVFNLSGGKDSTCAAFFASQFLDRMGHPRNRRVAIHADLGRAEWRSTPQTVAEIAEYLRLPLIIVRRTAGDMVARWEQRFARGKQRYEALETYNLIGPWSSASLRFCTSELKVQVIRSHLSKQLRGETIVSVVGLRREESVARRNAPISRVDGRFSDRGNRAGTRMFTWHPVLDWTADDVFAAHRSHNMPLHEAYCRYHSTRLSCAFCVLASAHDLAAATRAPGNLDLYRHLVGIEATSTFSFQPSRWLADVAPHLLGSALQSDIARAKDAAAERRRIEAAMPPGLRFVKGWPPRLPSLEEAELIALARRPILARHDLKNCFPDGAAVRARFADLLAIRDAA